MTETESSDECPNCGSTSIESIGELGHRAQFVDGGDDWVEGTVHFEFGRCRTCNAQLRREPGSPWELRDAEPQEKP